MSVSRYRSDTLVRAGQLKRTAVATTKIRKAIERGDIAIKEVILKEGERLDHLSSRFYGDGRYWWVLAAASNIGWWLQAPPGTIIRVPTSLPSVLGFV